MYILYLAIKYIISYHKQKERKEIIITNWVERVPGKITNSSDFVKKRFFMYRKKLYLRVQLHLSLLTQLGITLDDRIKFFRNENNFKKWMVDKASGVEEGYALTHQSSNNWGFVQIRFSDINPDLLDEEDYKLKSAYYEIKDNKLIIDGE